MGLRNLLMVGALVCFLLCTRHWWRGCSCRLQNSNRGNGVLWGSQINLMTPRDMCLLSLQSYPCKSVHALIANADFTSVKCLMNAAAPSKPELADALTKRIGCVFTQWYGCTEASPSIISQQESEAHILGTIGRLLSNIQMRVVDAQEAGESRHNTDMSRLLTEYADVERGALGEL
jgi:acyl-CoA synthetase (AMP-forming)/AMP-acid ligase II